MVKVEDEATQVFTPFLRFQVQTLHSGKSGIDTEFTLVSKPQNRNELERVRFEN